MRGESSALQLHPRLWANTAQELRTKRIAGHANITTTRKYVHPTPKSMKDAFRKKTTGEQHERRKAGRKQMVAGVAVGSLPEGQTTAEDLGIPA